MALDVCIGLHRGAFSLQAELQVAAGEIMVLIGPSAAGKTTLLKAIAGLAKPQAGFVRIGGQAAFDAKRGIDVAPWRRRVGMVFQESALFPHLSVRANVMFGLRGVPNASARAAEWLAAVGVAELADRMPRELSGGQQQRVALARAAARDADVLLLDEPFGSLDPLTRRSVRWELRRFAQQAAQTSGRALLLVSHDYLDALTLGDRIAVLEDGRITQVDNREELLRQPRTQFLADLAGHNVLEGMLEPARANSNLREVRVGPLMLQVAEAGDEPPGPVFVAFHPHEVSLLKARSLVSPRNQFPAVVRELVPLRDRLRVYLDAGVPIMADIVREAAADLDLRDGAPVVAAIKATAIEVYR